MLAQVARAGVRRQLARASTTQLLQRSFAQATEQVADALASDKVQIDSSSVPVSKEIPGEIG